MLAIEMTRILLHFLASLFKGIEFVTINSSISDLFNLSIAGPDRTGWVIYALTHFAPLYFNALNPSSKLGWNEKERKSFNERMNFDAIIALAFEHHLTLANNVPLEETIKWLMNIAPKGLVEFVDKNE